MITATRRMEIERSIVRATIESALCHGFALSSVHNGEEDAAVRTVDEAMMHAFECDEAHVLFTHPNANGHSWLYVVLGNEGYTVISDYTVDLTPAVDDTEALVNAYEEEYYR